MSLYSKIILGILALAYLVSPMDIIPEILIPYLGWIDDSLVLGTIYYMLRYNRLPDMTFFRNRLFKQTRNPHFGSSSEHRQDSRNGDDNSHSQHRNSKRNDQFNNGSVNNNSNSNPYDILGIPRGASKAEVQAAYKAAIKKYHPDKLSHLGEEFAHLANKKFLEIQDAYDELMKRF